MMKRFWIGMVVLVALLALGIAVSMDMDAIHRPMALQLQQAAQAAMAEDWPVALEMAQKARDNWKRQQHRIAAFADHTPMDEIEGLFAEMDIYAQAGEAQHFAATCARLAQLAEAMGESHRISWWNLL